MAATLATIDKLLKAQYLPAIVNTFQEETNLLGEILKRKESAKGGDVEMLVRLGRNTGIGFRGDGDTLPSAGNSTWDRKVIGPKWMYGRIQVSGPAMARTEGGSAKAFLKTFVDETKHTMTHFKKRANIQLWGQEEGYLGQVASVTSTTIVLDAPGVVGDPTHANYNAGTRHFPYGDVLIDLVDSDGSTIHLAGLSITSVAHTTNTLTVSGGDPSAAGADGDFVALGSGKTAGVDTWESDMFEGVFPAVDNGDVRTTYHGLSRTTYPSLKAVVLKNTSAQRDLTEGLMEDACKQVYLKSGYNPMDGKYGWCMSLGLHSRFVSSQIPVKRFQSTSLKAGYSQIDFNGIAVKPDVDAPYEAAYLLNMDNFKFQEVSPLGWQAIDGPVLSRVANIDAYEARLRWGGELVAQNLHSMAVIRNLNDDAYHGDTF